MHTQLPLSQAFLHLKSCLPGLLPNPTVPLGPGPVCMKPLTHVRYSPTFLAVPSCCIPNKPKSFLPFKVCMQSLVPSNFSSCCLEKAFDSETIRAISNMIWLFKHLNLPQDARTESCFELTNPATFFAVQILLGAILENPDKPMLAGAEDTTHGRQPCHMNEGRQACWDSCQPGDVHSSN